MKNAKIVSVMGLSLLLATSMSAVASQKAGRSTELAVSPTFDFSSHKQMVLDVSVANSIERTDITVYLQPEHKRSRILASSILFSGKTDKNGFLSRGVEVPAHIETLYVEAKSDGTPKEQTVEVVHDSRVSVNF